jgi:hypothetical protein
MGIRPGQMTGRPGSVTRLIAVFACVAALGLLSACSSAAHDATGRQGSASAAETRRTSSSGGDTQPPKTEHPSTTPAGCGDPNQCTQSSGVPRIIIDGNGCGPVSPAGVAECHVDVTAENAPLTVTGAAVQNSEPGSDWTVVDGCIGELMPGDNCTIRVSVTVPSGASDVVTSADLQVTSDEAPATSAPLNAEALPPTNSSS